MWCYINLVSTSVHKWIDVIKINLTIKSMHHSDARFTVKKQTMIHQVALNPLDA